MDVLWAVAILAILFYLCRLLMLLIPPVVPEIVVDTSDVMLGKGGDDDSYIYVARRRSGDEDTVHCYDPATMKYLGQLPALNFDEVSDHVARAREAQKKWARSSFEKRRQLLRILLKYTIDHQELICEVSARDSGKTLVDAALGEILTTCEKITWLVGQGEQWLQPEYRSAGRMMLHKTARVEYSPIGVIGAIVPWNYPFHNILNPMVSAVFAGNAIVIKVSEHASWSAFFYSRIIKAALRAAGAPADLVHVITGYGETGKALVSLVDKLIFVGSTAVGKMVMEQAAKTLTPVVLELGGKDPFIVCEDADVLQVAQIAARAALQSSGQNCAGAERFYIHAQIYQQFVDEVVRIVRTVRMGPPLEGLFDMGAVCIQEHTDRLQALVNDAVTKGAEIAVRGDLVLPDFGNSVVGQFYPPTVLLNVNHSMRLMQEEIFGPIIPIMKFHSDDEAITLANDSNFGLGCSVFSANKERAVAIASKIYCGMAAINDFAVTYMCQSLPFGGVKNSGFGKFAGVEGLRGCCLVKSIAEDRFSFFKTVIPKPLQYPVAENAFQFEEALVRMFYGLTVVEKFQGLVNLVKIFTEQKDVKKTL
ncbi:aldehyde dehydrogenase 22A1 [Selaginella moellendorffii]|uniref:aldehyde dehydrogenase 22A1 n=1 Tax=Selaginella moellendorffii TaxID=88036 RepID=UPI000D1C687F|nr:aldehyde dehydrogenase 22A1 [Selaginella moellendorffii]|eukprot:XP_024539998.1 aldehyde dehydrogenase 22A1 [Selaginella moellendorffii]